LNYCTKSEKKPFRTPLLYMQKMLANWSNFVLQYKQLSTCLTDLQLKGELNPENNMA